MKTRTIKIYEFDELPDKAKEKAIERFADVNVDYDWWEYIYEDARNVGLKLTGFGLDRSSYCKGDFIESPEETAQGIIDNHGESCDTYSTAKNYLEERSELVKKYSDGVSLDIVAEGNEYDFDNECDELDKEFLRSILEDYRIMLQKECEYLTSREAIEETIKINEYEFLEDGTLA